MAASTAVGKTECPLKETFIYGRPRLRARRFGSFDLIIELWHLANRRRAWR